MLCLGIGSGGRASPVRSFLAYSLTVFSRFFRVGDFKLMSHYDAALYTARRLEMCEIVEMTLFYFVDRPQVHSPLSGLPFMVITLTSLWVHESYVSLSVQVLNAMTILPQYIESRVLYCWGVVNMGY